MRSDCKGASGADGKIIKAGAVSVQSNLNYEQEFALEMQKAKVCRVADPQSDG